MLLHELPLVMAHEPMIEDDQRHARLGSTCSHFGCSGTGRFSFKQQHAEMNTIDRHNLLAAQTQLSQFVHA